MVRFMLAACFAFTAMVCPAQQNLIDSLTALLNSHRAEDTVRLNLLNQIAYEATSQTASRGMAAADQAIALAKKLNQPAKLARAYSCKGWIYNEISDYPSAAEMFITALYLYRQTGQRLEQGKMFYSLGMVYYSMADYLKAIDQHTRAARLFEQVHDRSRMANSLNSIGANYYELANYPQAINYYLKALKIEEQLDEWGKIAMSFRNVGMVNKQLGKHAMALDYYARSYNIFKKLHDSTGMAGALNSMGTMQEEQNDSRKAISTYREALDINKRIHDTSGIADNLTNISISYISLKNYVQAYEYLEKSLTIHQRLHAKDNLALVWRTMADVVLHAPASFLLQQGIRPNRRFSRALELKQQGVHISKEIGDLYGAATGLEELSNLYELQKDYPNALRSYKEFVTLRDSVFAVEKREEIAGKQMQYTFDKKEDSIKSENNKQQALAAATLKQQRTVNNAVIAGATVLLLAAAFVFIFYKRRRDALQKQKEAEFRLQVSDTEMKALRAQMNPHFIFNSLNSISDYISKNDTGSADYYLTRFARVMRMILENSEQKEVSLAADLHVLELYMQLESMRMNHAFTYEIVVDSTIDPENTLIPPLILQPFVENSIWHGLARKQGAGKIVIRIQKQDDMLHCIVEDNGIGREKAISLGRPQQQSSLGMKITSARIDIINKLKKSKAGVQLSDLAEGTRVDLMLPLEMAF